MRDLEGLFRCADTQLTMLQVLLNTDVPNFIFFLTGACNPRLPMCGSLHQNQSCCCCLLSKAMAAFGAALRFLFNCQMHGSKLWTLFPQLCGLNFEMSQFRHRIDLMEPTDNELPDSLTEMPLIDKIMPTLLPALQVSLLGL